METTGTIKVIQDTQKVSDRFRKRNFVLTIGATTPYPQHVEFQMTHDKCDVLNGYSVGQQVKVQFNLQGREWNGPQGIKHFNTLEAWRIESLGNEVSEAEAGKNPVQSPSFTAFKMDEDDGLPY